MQAPSEAEAQCAELARGGKVVPSSLVTHCPVLKSYRYMRQGQKTWIP